jgi:tetratricopeptide (TPR) repeat protein
MSLEDDATLLDVARARLDAIAAAPPGADRARLRVSAAKMLMDRCGQIDASIEQMFCAVDDDPTDAEAIALLARTLERERRFEEAARVLKRRLFALRAGTPEHAACAWHLARMLECARRHPEATAAYESILDLADRQAIDADTVRALAARLEALNSGRLGDCLELWSRLEPGSLPGLAPRLVELRTIEGDESGLMRALELGLTVAPAQAEWLDALVRLREARGDYAAVALLLHDATLAAPQDVVLLRRLVDAHRRAGSEWESLGPIDVAIAGRPSDIELRLLRAGVRERLGDVDAAVADLRTVEGDGGANRDVAVRISRRILARAGDAVADEHVIVAVDILLRAGECAEAERALEVVLARDPAHAGALQRLASTSVARGDWDRAADVWGRLVSVLELPPDDPASAGLVVAFADACERAGRPGDAREALERAHWRRSDDTGVLASCLERTCEATGAWQRLSELLVARAHRTTNAAQREKLLLRAAKLLVDDAGAPSDALAILERVCAECHESIEAPLERARVLIAMKRPSDALTVLEPVVGRARRKSPLAGADVLLERGRAYLALEQLYDAFASLKLAFSLYKGNREVAMLLGVVALDLGDETTAEAALRAVCRLASSDGSGGGDGEADARVASSLLAAIAPSRDAHAKSHHARARAAPQKLMAVVDTRAGADGQPPSQRG